jgi:hypothetical protein
MKQIMVGKEYLLLKYYPASIVTKYITITIQKRKLAGCGVACLQSLYFGW